MDAWLRVDWHALFIPKLSPAEIILRGVIIYVGLCLLLRIVLKRQAGRVALSDLLVITLVAGVCRRAFRSGDCEGLPSRPRKLSRTFRRRLKGTARPGWRGWATGDSAPTGVDTGEAPPVGSVSMFRSADGQPPVREATHIFKLGRITVRSCNPSVEVGTGADVVE